MIQANLHIAQLIFRKILSKNRFRFLRDVVILRIPIPKQEFCRKGNHVVPEPIEKPIGFSSLDLRLSSRKMHTVLADISISIGIGSKSAGA